MLLGDPAGLSLLAGRVFVADNLRFMVDSNVGSLARWLRMLGYDSLFFDSGHDSLMIAIALSENRVVITRDREIVRRREVARGQLKVVLITSDLPEQQMRQLVETLNLDCQSKPFSLCLECNRPLEERDRQQVKDLVPAYVFQTQSQFRQCPACRRIYWRGSHWQAMNQRIEGFRQG